MPKDRKKPVILGEKTTVLLWGFKVNVKDRRDGEVVEGYIVVTGNEEYDIDVAAEEVRKKYNRIGYDVTVCEFDESRAFLFDALETFREAQPDCDKCKKCDYYINEDENAGQQQGCELIEDKDLKEDEPETYEKVVKAYGNVGAECPLFEAASTEKEEQEDKPNYLDEIMATLGELEEGAK